MATTPFSASGTTSAVLALSKVSWKIGIALSNLNEDVEGLGSNIKDLSGEVKALGIECDLLYTQLEMLISKTGRPLTTGVDSGVLECLTLQVDEASRTVHELELFVRIARGEETKFIGQAQRLRKLDKSKNRIAENSFRIARHIHSFRLILLLLNTLTLYLVPGRADPQLIDELNKSQIMAKDLQISARTDPDSRLSHAEVTLMGCAQEVIRKGTVLYESSQAAESARHQHQNTSYSRVGAWVHALEAMQEDQRHLTQPNMLADIPSFQPGKEAHEAFPRNPSREGTTHEQKDSDAKSDESDHDLENDLIKAALETGTEAFKKQDWGEAQCLLHEALRILQQLTMRHRGLFDIFSLHYRLAVCTYYTQEPVDATEALISLIQQPGSSDVQRAHIYDAMHLLSQLYIRIGQVDRAKIECEKALQARRRLLGKQNKASLESLALMAHIYVLMDNRALAKSYLSMIPEAQREAILASVENSLGPTVEHLDFSSLLTPSMPNESPRRDPEARSFRNEASGSPVGLGMNRYTYGSASTGTSSPTASPWLSTRPVTMASLSLADGRRMSTATERTRLTDEYAAEATESSPITAGSGDAPSSNEGVRNKKLSRKEILDKVGCQPRDRIEEAVCIGDLPALINLLNKKKGFWRSGMRKRVRPERVTALHFAALFGEIDMARRLLDSNFNINEIPFGYSTSLTPLHFAIGARQVDMVEFLIAHGANPTDPDTWSSLAGQLMSRSWLAKTMSEAEKEFVPHRIMAIMGFLLKQGWNVNTPIEASGKTVLHQAVSFWTGSYQWDLNLRDTVTSFLCEQGADAFRANREGKTPWDLALASGHENLLLILDRGSRRKEMDDRVAHLVELPS